MGRPLSDDEKAARSERGRAHWATVKSVAAKASIRTEFVAQHWSQIKPVATDVISGDAMAIAMLRGLVAQESAELRRRAALSRSPVSAPPDMDGMVRIMKWAIKTCGADIELARMAFVKAASTLRGE